MSHTKLDSLHDKLVEHRITRPLAFVLYLPALVSISLISPLLFRIRYHSILYTRSPRRIDAIITGDDRSHQMLLLLNNFHISRKQYWALVEKTKTMSPVHDLESGYTLSGLAYRQLSISGRVKKGCDVAWIVKELASSEENHGLLVYFDIINKELDEETKVLLALRLDSGGERR